MKPVLNEYGVLETSRQGEVRVLIMQGLTNREIGQRLGIKEKSVKWQVTNLYKSWDVKTRGQFMVRIMTLDRMNRFYGPRAERLPKGK